MVFLLLILPFVCVFTIGLVFLEDTKLYSEEGLIFFVSSIAFAVFCWSIVVIADFREAYPKMNSKREKIVYSVLLFLYFAVSIGYVFTTYWYISIGCEVAKLEALENAAIESKNFDLSDLPLRISAMRTKLLTAKTVNQVCRLFFFCLFISAPRVKESQKETLPQ